jgi:hypothetical protein
MKPETSAFPAKSKELLDRAPALLAQNFTDDAGRAAYLAGFHVEIVNDHNTHLRLPAVLAI